MCGFAGEARFDSSVADISAVARMGDVLQPRGPDASGAFQQGGIALTHRRLRIIDLSEHAQQPMSDPALGMTVVFNGCIYNYRELRRELEVLDYRFFSDGDTEVVLKSFHAWGRDCVNRFHGMFATASASSPCTWPRAPAGCASRLRCPRCWLVATSTRRSTRSRFTTT